MESAAAQSPFPPIQDYAFLSDCESCALVSPDGAVEWLCLPRPDSPSVFGAMLDRSAGTFRLSPEDIMVPSQRRYLPGTLVLETTWQTPSGWLVVHDYLAMQEWESDRPRPGHYRRAPADFVAEGALVRTATCIEGQVELAMTCLPAFDYGRAGCEWEYQGDRYDVAVAKPEQLEGGEFRLTSSIRLGLAGQRAYGHTLLHEGESVFVAASWNGDGPMDEESAFERGKCTARFWREWLKDGSFPDHRWRAYLERSAVALKGLSYAPSGAVMAAATTSLPETPGGERNWDYRYSWVRDSSFMLWSLYTLGFDWEAYEYFAFLTETVAAGPLQVMYGVGGERELAESELNHLSGYGGAKPVRIGNGAYRQQQHDVWGMLVDAIVVHTRQARGQEFPTGTWELIAGFVDDAAENWREPDRGIWEVRGEPKHFTASKVMCWVALDRGAKLADVRDDEDRAKRWREIADEIRDDVCENGVDERGVFVQHYETDALDASLLLLPIVDFLPADDERIRATVLAIADELTEHGLVLRYKVEHTDDGLSGREGTFTICSFWLVSALTLIGEVDRARELCEKLLSLCGALGLYAEELDANSGRHLGNFPQAFTHLSQINALMGLIRAEQKENEG